MKNKFCWLRVTVLMCSLLFIAFAASGKSNPFKFGKVDKSELEMVSYEADTAAVALVLYHDGYTTYEYIMNEFRVNTTITKRIKILTPEGVDKATVSIAYYYRDPSLEERIEKLEAFSYNLENGKVVKTKLEKKYIFDEKLSDYYKQRKFAIPNVKAGSVIEYRYSISSKKYYEMPNWLFQEDIPVKEARYEVLIPEYFQYNIESKGYHQIDTQEESINQNFSIHYTNGIETVTCKSRNITYQVNDLPALNDDSHVWQVRDYMTGLSFELKATYFPGDFYRPYTRTWDDLDKILKDKTDFSNYINRSNPFKKETASLLDSADNEKKKIQLIYAFVRGKIRWDENYAFISNPASAVKEGVGNNAQINCVLMSMLKDAGIKSYPVLMSRRSRGRLPYTYPSLDQLNTFVVMAVTGDGKRYFMDGSALYGGLNMLPSDLLVDRARILGDDVSEKWINLTDISKNFTIQYISSELMEDGTLKGKCVTNFINQPAYFFRSKYNGNKDKEEYTVKLSTELEMQIDSLSLKGEKDQVTETVVQEFNFTRPGNGNGNSEFIYINPLVFGHISKNPFTQSDRKLPVEFNYPSSYLITSIIRIPANYQVEDLPGSDRFKLNNQDGSLTYVIQKMDEQTLQLTYRFDLNKVIFSSLEYQALKEFYAHSTAKNASMIVLKRRETAKL